MSDYAKLRQDAAREYDEKGKQLFALDEKFKALAELQPGLGTVMMEYSALFVDAGCNACHKDQGFPFIKYELPKVAPMPLVAAP